MTNSRAMQMVLAVVLATLGCSKHDEAGKASGVPPLPNAPDSKIKALQRNEAQRKAVGFLCASVSPW